MYRVINILLSIMLIISCNDNPNSNPVESDINKYHSLDVIVFWSQQNKEINLENICVTLDTNMLKTNVYGEVHFDSLLTGKHRILIEDPMFIQVDTLINLRSNDKIKIELLSIINEITWIGTEGLSERAIQIEAHPNGYLIATPTFSTSWSLYKLNSGDTNWTYTGFDDIKPPYFITTEGTILSSNKRSTDEGKSWSNISTGGVSCFAESKGIIYAGGYGGDDWNSMNFSMSTDDGIHWTKKNIYICYPLTYVSHIMINRIGEVFLFEDSGEDLYKYENDEFSVVKRSFKTYSSAMDRDGNLFAGEFAIYRSSNDGVSWDQVSENWDGNLYIDYVVNSRGHIFVAQYQKGVFRSTDNGTSWEAVGLKNRNIFRLCIDANDFLYVSMWEADVIYRTLLPTVRN